MIISPIAANLTSEGRYEITGRGTVYVVRNPRDCKDIKWLMNQWIRLDGRVVEVVAIDHYAINGTYLAGKPLGLIVREISPADSVVADVADSKPTQDSV